MIHFDEDSPLQRLPVGLDPKQGRILDGIRLTAETAGIAYDRLEATALQASEAEEMWGGLIPVLFADVWACIDAVNRLRDLVGLLAGDPSESPFRQATKDVRDLRDAVQHAGKRLDSLVAAKQPLLGTLTWVYTPDAEGLDRQFAVTLAGRLPDGEYSPESWNLAPLVASASRTIDHIALSSHQPPKRAAQGGDGAPYRAPARPGGVSVSLTVMIGEVELMVRGLEAQLAPQIEGHEVAASGAMFMLHLKLSSPREGSEPGTEA